MQIELAQRAAKWWADCLRNGAKLDNGAKDHSNLMAQGLAGLLQKAAKRPVDAIDRFEAALCEYFVSIETDSYYMASVDYNPCPNLANAAEKAGMNLGMASLPWKTSMIYRNGKVMLKAGYGATPSEL